MNNCQEFAKIRLMHELSIVNNILEIAEENARKNNAKIIREIELDIGELSGVEFDALEFAFENCQKTGMLKDVKFIVNRIPGKAVCNSCTQEFEACDYYTPCPKCSSFDVNINQGKEIKIKSIRID